MSVRGWCLAMILALASGPAAAHDLWLTFGADGRAIVNYGHPDDRLPPDPERLVELRWRDAPSALSLIKSLTRSVRDGIPVVVTEPTVSAGGMLLARYDNGLWVETTEGWRNAGPRMVAQAARSMWSMKFAKALLPTPSGAAPGFDRPVGLPLEIVPLDDPFRRMAGERLRVRVLFDGKPLGGVDVELGDGVTPVPEKGGPRFATDADGLARLPVDRAGLYLVVVDHNAPGAMPAVAATDLFNATLTFVRPR